jgi:hypothetical protein
VGAWFFGAFGSLGAKSDLKEQCLSEVYQALEQFGAGGDTQWMPGNWGDIDNDAQTLANLREYRQMFLV